MSEIVETQRIDFATLELLPYGVIVLDRGGTVLFYNQREQEIAGRKATSVLGRNFFTEVAPCTSVGTFYDRFRETVLEEGRTAEFKFHFPFPDNPRDVEIALTAFQYHEELLCLVSVRDVTEEEQIRDHILTSQRFADVGEIASTVAHNFNNTLMAVSMWASVIRRQLPADHPAQKAALQITRTVEDATAMTKRIQDSLRDTPNDSSAAQLVDLREVILLAIDQVRGRIEAKCAAMNAELKIESLIAEDIQPVRGFAGELTEVFLNLLANGVDAMECAGTISIRAFNERDRVNVEVTDTGGGMSIETRKKLFRPLFSTKGAKGTGLGLSSSYAALRRHGGDIQVESELGQGSTFRVVLPLAR